ncbi:uncharacterized protein BDW70DRAFT_162833 [Aspergillus foveolatus]|uniref:uncharacterized protein n=1 Tax=Aspergillus foveolatus TaxID=210207 RepID=UPI003CCE1830
MALTSSFFEMGIELALQGFDGDRTYTSGEAVTGSLLLKLDRPTIIPNITVSLHGSIRTSLIGKGSPFILGNDLPTVAQENHQIFRLSNRLFPPRDAPQLPKSYTLSNGEYSFQFEICFPQALNTSDTQLPPSFINRSETHGAEARIEYFLRIDLKRSGRFRRRITIERHLNFIPSDAAPIRSAYLISGFNKRRVVLYNLSPAHTQAGSAVPVLILEAVLPYPFVLYTGGNLPMRLRLRRLPAKLNCKPIKLKYVAISIRSTVTVSAGLHRTSWHSSQALVTLSELDDLISCGDEESFTDINSSILDNTIVPKVPSTFNDKLAEQKYSLEVEAGFSLGDAIKLKMLRIPIEVRVWSGFCSEGSERGISATGGSGHLDLLGAFDADEGREPLPCYSPA